MIVELIRHGETALQVERRYQGKTDAPLSSGGRMRLHMVNTSCTLVYVSPLLRARETAEILFPNARQVVVPELAEMDFGAFEGRSYRELAENHAYRAWVEGGCTGQCPGGESKNGFCTRVCAAFEALLQLAWRRRESEVIIIAHGGTQMAVMERFAERARPYFAWQLPCGQGYQLDTESWHIKGKLRLIKVRDYNGG